MKSETRAKLSIALILVFVVGIAVGADVIASQQARKLGLQGDAVVPASAKNKQVPAASSEKRDIVVLRRGVPFVTFTDEAAVAYELESVQRELKRFEVALGKDLAHGDFRARRTRRAIGIPGPSIGLSTADGLVAARREFNLLREALRTDLASSDFHARRTRREVAKSKAPPPATEGDAVASGVVSLSDDLWNLEMAVEKDIHNGDFRAVETHFAIDRRRWKVD